MQSDSGELIPASYVFPLIAGVTVATVALTLYCFSHGISTVFMHLYYLPTILIAYFYRRRGIPVFTGLSLLYLALATFFLYPSILEIEGAVLRTGMFILIGVVVAELSERLQREKEDYRLAHEYEKSIIDNANVWLMVLDPSGRIVGWNHAAEQISGYPAAEVIGGNEVWKYLYPEKNYRKEITGKITTIIQKDNYLENLQTTIVTKNRTKKTIVWNTRGLPDSEGTIRNYIAIGIDITDLKQAEAALGESEEKFRAFFTTSKDCVFITSKDGHWIDFNNSAVELFGYPSREELMKVNIADLYAHPKERNVHMKIISEQGFSKEHPVDLKKKDGAIIHALVTSVARQDQTGTIIGFQGTVRDITDLKRAERELQQLASVVRYSSELIGIASLDGTVIFLNDAGARMVGIPPEDAKGKKIFRFIPDHLKEKVNTEILPAMMDHGIWQGDLQYQNQQTGNLTDVHAMAFMITDPVTRKPLYQANVSLDITDRKRAEEALKKIQNQLTEALDLAHMAHWELDVPTGIFTFNDRFYALYGTTAGREGGYQMPVEVYAKEFVHPEDAHLVADEVNMAIASTDPDYTRQIEHRIVRRDGDVRYIIVRFGITKDTDGRTVKTHGANQDITERKRAEEALRQVNKQLNLLSSITRHDILNQLMALKGYLYLSMKMVDNPTILAGYIQKEEQAANAIENQITFTRDYQELGATTPEWQSVNESIEKALLGLPMRAIHIEIDPNNPEIFADRLFGKVFYNLIDNALRYGGADMKTIRVSSTEIDSALHIVCEDDGVGISLEDKKKLFTKGFGKNTGLGLFLSREILAITGITITENGTPGKGARFEITVPKEMYRFKM